MFAVRIGMDDRFAFVRAKADFKVERNFAKEGYAKFVGGLAGTTVIKDMIQCRSLLKNKAYC